MEIPFTASEFDAFSTYFADGGTNHVALYDMEIFVPHPEPDVCATRNGDRPGWDLLGRAATCEWQSAG